MSKESICSPLLREGGVRGGEARGGSDEGSTATGEAINKVRPIIIIWLLNRLYHYSSLPPLTPPPRRRGLLAASFHPLFHFDTPAQLAESIHQFLKSSAFICQ